MSLIPGVTVIKDPQANLIYTWDWSAWLVSPATISTSTFYVSTIDGDGAPLTSSSASIVTGSLKTQTLLSGGTAGKKYTVTNRIVTAESPAQTDDRSIVVKISAQ